MIPKLFASRDVPDFRFLIPSAVPKLNMTGMYATFPGNKHSNCAASMGTGVVAKGSFSREKTSRSTDSEEARADNERVAKDLLRSIT